MELYLTIVFEWQFNCLQNWMRWVMSCCWMMTALTSMRPLLHHLFQRESPVTVRQTRYSTLRIIITFSLSLSFEKKICCFPKMFSPCFWLRVLIFLPYLSDVGCDDLCCLSQSSSFNIQTFKTCVYFAGWCFGGWIWSATDSCILNKRWMTAALWLEYTFICRWTFIHIRPFDVETLHQWGRGGLCVLSVTNYMLACGQVVYWTFPPFHLPVLISFFCSISYLQII